uniref:Uncharacterized protein n=1 Tax=Oryza brachyantha TaxID=4533 RepID=J3LAQ2_ORYBR
MLNNRFVIHHLKNVVLQRPDQNFVKFTQNLNYAQHQQHASIYKTQVKDNKFLMTNFAVSFSPINFLCVWQLLMSSSGNAPETLMAPKMQE